MVLIAIAEVSWQNSYLAVSGEPSWQEGLTNILFKMFWPTVLSHKIDSDSPLWDVSARDISSKQFEVVLTFEGTTPETGNTVQVHRRGK